MKKSRNAEEFPERLQLAMKNAGVSQADLARKLGTAWSTVARWHAGSMPRTKTLNELAAVLGVASRWLKSGEGEQAPNDQVRTVGADAFGGKMPEGFSFCGHVAALMEIVGYHSTSGRGVRRLLLDEVERQAKEFFGTVWQLAKWAAKAADHVPDEEMEAELQYLSDEVARADPEVREWLKLLIDQARAALAAEESKPEE